MTILERIDRLKRERGAAVAAHTYQAPEVQACADILGDSFVLAKKAAASPAETVVLCGVRFMAEGIKILSPGKKVILAEPSADCPMARQIPPERVAAFRPGASGLCRRRLHQHHRRPQGGVRRVRHLLLRPGHRAQAAAEGCSFPAG